MLIGAQEEGELRAEEEAGDLLFAAVNAVRLSGVHAEDGADERLRKICAQVYTDGETGRGNGPEITGKNVGRIGFIVGKGERTRAAIKRLDIPDGLIENVQETHQSKKICATRNYH